MSTATWSLPFVAVHQVLPSLHVADASGAHTLHARDALRAAGYRSEIFVQRADEPLRAESVPFAQLDAHVVAHQTAVLYQLAVGSTVADELMERTEPLIVNYHNLTPASFFWQWAPEWLEAVVFGRNQLVRLRTRAVHGIAVSTFNEQDLIGAGYSSTSTVPPFVDVGAAVVGPPDRRHPDPRGTGTSWLFVGKLLPHKAAHDVIKAFCAYRRAYDARATLTLVGGHPVPRYAEALRAFVAELALDDAVRFAGSVSADELEAAYGDADVFVCLSDHEGFCFPLLETMARDLPIVAFAAGAVPDTLGNAGVLLHDKDPALVAAAVRRVVTDEALRTRLVRAGRRRLVHFDLEDTKIAFAAEVGRVLARTRQREREDALELATAGPRR